MHPPLWFRGGGGVATGHSLAGEGGPNSDEGTYTVVPPYLDTDMSWYFSFICCTAVCAALEQGVAAIFGPGSGFTAHHVQSICDSKVHTSTTANIRKGISISRNMHKEDYLGPGGQGADPPPLTLSIAKEGRNHLIE